MNQKLEIPHGFALCGEAECLCAEGCLRHRAYLQQAETVKVFTVVNPRFCTKDGQCAYFRDAGPVNFARGFTQMQKRMAADFACRTAADCGCCPTSRGGSGV